MSYTLSSAPGSGSNCLSCPVSLARDESCPPLIWGIAPRYLGCMSEKQLPAHKRREFFWSEVAVAFQRVL